MTAIESEVDLELNNVTNGLQEIKSLINNLSVGDFLCKRVELIQNYYQVSYSQANPSTIISVSKSKPSIAVCKVEIDPFRHYNAGVCVIKPTIDGVANIGGIGNAIMGDLWGGGFYTFVQNGTDRNPYHMEFIIPFKQSLKIEAVVERDNITQLVGVASTIYIYS